ncbi:hypothetical protein Tco_1203501 [Tanacetum coccineum]
MTSQKALGVYYSVHQLEKANGLYWLGTTENKAPNAVKGSFDADHAVCQVYSRRSSGSLHFCVDRLVRLCHLKVRERRKSAFAISQ